MPCYLCGSDQATKRNGKVRDSDDIDILECDDCGLVYLSKQDHLDEQHYENSGMHDGEAPDVESWLKETQNDDERRYQFLKEKITNRTVLDFGCGVGGFLDLAKQSASCIDGIELERALQSSFKQRGLQVFSQLKEAMGSEHTWDVVTAFHVVEHLSDPMGTIKDLSTLLSRGGEMIIEVPSSDDALLTLYKNAGFQEFTYWSQHLYLFNASTMKFLIKKAGLKLNWIKHVQRYPLSNHLYWLSKGKPGGHKQWAFLDDQQLNQNYEQQLAALGLTDTIVAGISV